MIQFDYQVFKFGEIQKNDYGFFREIEFYDITNEIAGGTRISNPEKSELEKYNSVGLYTAYFRPRHGDYGRIDYNTLVKLEPKKQPAKAA